MQEIFRSIRRSLVFRFKSGDDGGGGGGGTIGCMVEKTGTSIRKSRIGLFTKQAVPALPPIVKTNALPIRWRKDELIRCDAFGHVYMGMNLDSGELFAVKQTRGSDLVVRVRKPETVLVKMAKAIGADAVYAHKEVSHDKVKSEVKIEAAIKKEGVELKYF